MKYNRNCFSTLTRLLALPLAFAVAACGDNTNTEAVDTTTEGGAGTGTGAGGIGPSPVVLGAADQFTILSKAGIDTVPPSVITGDIAVSPIDSTAITHFSETLDESGEFSTSDQVVGQIYAANYADPTPDNLTTAVGAMETAYTNAAGRSNPDFVEQFAGDLGGKTLGAGLYKWGTSVIIPTNVTLKGGPNDVWIFQIAGNLTMSSAKRVILSGGARPENIHWQVAGFVSIGTTAHFEGVVLCQTDITLKTGSTMNGRLFAQTAVNLQSATVTQP